MQVLERRLAAVSAWAGVARRGRQIPCRPISSEAFSGAFFFIKTLFAYRLFVTFICSPCFASGPSMMPTLNRKGDIVGVNKLVRWFGSVRAGDIVLLKSPLNPKMMLAKRVLGPEGNIVRYRVDPNNINSRMTQQLVPKGHVWVQGDNIYASRDSRHFGAVPVNIIRGRIFCRIWPLPVKTFGLTNSKVQKKE